MAGLLQGFRLVFGNSHLDKREKRVALRLLGFTIASAVFLHPNTGRADTGSVTVVKPTVFSGASYPGALVLISPAIPGLGGCSNAPGQYVFINFSFATAPGGRDLYATVLAGFLAGHTISFGISGCSSDGSYPLVTAVSIDP